MTRPAPPGRIAVPADWEGQRLDRALATHLDVPRSRVQAWIRAGRVRLGGRPAAKAGETLRAGIELAWDPPELIDERIVPEAGDLAVLFEDADLVALDKPAGIVVHPGAGRRTGTLAHRLLDRYPELAGVGGPGRPGIVHRLDRGTSGAMLVARNAATHARLTRMFAARRVDKRYLAIVWGTPRGERGEMDAPIGRHPRDRKRMAAVRSGREARTGWTRLASAGPVSLLEFRLFTGRTHQIRVHARTAGHPLVGDETYGEPRWRHLKGPAAAALAAFPRPALHAWTLTLEHPTTGEPLRIEAPVPADLRDLWRAVGGDDDAWPRTHAE
jgi:23S rRNA pseudouridine1911/1915/1917 synthase